MFYLDMIKLLFLYKLFVSFLMLLKHLFSTTVLFQLNNNTILITLCMCVCVCVVVVVVVVVVVDKM